MHRLILLTLLTAVAWAQGDNPFNRPPADVDQALRARIKEFFGYHITEEYRKAEALVAEDTKDYFYSHNKPKYLSVKIGTIEYSDNFTKAKAVVLCEQNINMPMFSGKFEVPTPSTWKLENGKWVWWVDPAAVGSSPFGHMKAGPDTPAVNGAAVSMATMPKTVDFLFDQVKLDRKDLTLKPGESATVMIFNGAPGDMTILIQKPVLKGIDATLDKSTLKSGEKTTLTVKASEGAKSGALNLQVDPIGQILPIQISVKD
jgi:hypothetical protein